VNLEQGDTMDASSKGSHGDSEHERLQEFRGAGRIGMRLNRAQHHGKLVAFFSHPV
jgi:hypothetical protein